MPMLVDTKGLNCPLPVLRVRRAMKEVPAGEVVEVQATDPGAVKDLHLFCEASGNAMIDWNEDSGVFTFHIMRGA